MKTTFLLFFLFVCIFANAQKINIAYDSKEMASLLAGPLYVIPTGDKTFDDSLISTLTKYWDVCPFKALAIEEVDAAIEDKTKNFIACMDLTRSRIAFVSPETSPSHEFSLLNIPSSFTMAAIYIFQGKKHIKRNRMINVLTSSSFPFFERKLGLYGLPFVVKNLNDNVTIINKNKLDPVDKAFTRIGQAMSDQFCSNPQLLKERTLLISERLAIFLFKEKLFMKYYNYKFKVLKEEEIVQLLIANPNEFCFIPQYSLGQIEILDPLSKSKVYCGILNMTIGDISGKQIERLNMDILKPMK